MKRYGIFGGAFDPPHIAHLIVAESVRDQLELDKIIFIPSGNPPLKESIPVKDRMAMADIAFGSDKNYEVSDIELVNIKERSFTVNTLENLRNKYSSEDIKLFLIIGVDNLIGLSGWKDPDRLFEMSEVVVINRPNYDPKNSNPEFSDRVKFVDVPYLDISSSMIRELVRQGRSIKYMVSREVEEYIRINNLYKKS